MQRLDDKAGVPIKVISDRLGHATTAFTMAVYTHAIPAVEHEAAEQIADLVFGIGRVGEDWASPRRADGGYDA